MADSPFPFEPVPLRLRRDGWTPDRQRAFVSLIEQGLRPGRAAERLGLRRQGAYELRSRPGGEGFAAAWDLAAAAAARRRAAGRCEGGLHRRAVEGVPVSIRHRRRIVAVERRYDNAALVRLLGIVDSNGRNAGNAGPGLSSVMDAELLSAFAPDSTLPLACDPAERHSIGGGGIAAHPLDDVAEPPES